MREYPHYQLDGDQLTVRVIVHIPWLNKEIAYEHVLDEGGLRDEFQPLPEIQEYIDLLRRKELIEKRQQSVQHLGYIIARSILRALEHKP